ncbi:[FeFe] hydrogenase H-cluster radical SAM maturase HydE [Candidatus Kuenenbacteria bacterium]|nr:[FeFe] hydrogenase H-cluster radical SAM maturase HydE [Candidatus Kuenenbacteria bacterium]
MCYAIPGKIIKTKNKIAIIDYFGEHRTALNNFITAKTGDYVYAQGGIVVSKIPKEEAKELLEFWEEHFFKLKQVDGTLSKIKQPKNVSQQILQILQKVNLNQKLSQKNLLTLLNTKSKQNIKLILETANNIRQKIHQNSSCVHGIIEFSNYCQHDCHYCGIRKSQNVSRYRLSIDEIIKLAKSSVALGFKALVLQSGEDHWYTEEKLIKIVKELRKLNILIFLSIGERSPKTYKKLYQAGARAVLLRFETSNKNIFHKLKPESSLSDRLKLIKDLREFGYIIATGFLLGLPGETKQDIVNNILLAKSFQPDMYSFGPLIPTPSTPLAKQKLVTTELMLKTIATIRLIDKDCNILITSAFEALDKDAKKKGLLAGGNSLMINTTPTHYKKQYHLYPNRPDTNKTAINNIKQTTDLLYSLGRAPVELSIKKHNRQHGKNK